MFDRDVNYPTAVASYDDEGVRAAGAWCVLHMQDGDTLTVYTALKSSLRNCQALQHLDARHGDVEHVTGRGGSYVLEPGPVLMAWADMDDIGKMMRGGGRHVRALCIITWNEEAIRPWVSAMRPQLLGAGSMWTSATPDLDPVLVEALTSLTAIVNHNNTIAAGFEKDVVVARCWRCTTPTSRWKVPRCMPGRWRTAGPATNHSVWPSTSKTSTRASAPAAGTC